MFFLNIGIPFHGPSGSSIGVAYYPLRKFISPVNDDLVTSGSTTIIFPRLTSFLRLVFVSNATFLIIMIVQVIT